MSVSTTALSEVPTSVIMLYIDKIIRLDTHPHSCVVMTDNIHGHHNIIRNYIISANIRISRVSVLNIKSTTCSVLAQQYAQP